MSLADYIKRKRKLKKILLIGSGAVGKTSLVKVLSEDKTLEELEDKDRQYKRTLFFTFETVKAANVANFDTEGVFQLYDLAGQLDLPIHATKDIAATVLGSVDLFVFMYSGDSVQTLFDIEEWLKIIDNYYDEKGFVNQPEFVLVKNKADLDSSIDPYIIDSIIKRDSRFVNKFNISCLTGSGLVEFKQWLVDYCFIGDCEHV